VCEFFIDAIWNCSKEIPANLIEHIEKHDIQGGEDYELDKETRANVDELMTIIDLLRERIEELENRLEELETP